MGEERKPQINEKDVLDFFQKLDEANMLEQTAHLGMTASLKMMREIVPEESPTPRLEKLLRRDPPPPPRNFRKTKAKQELAQRLYDAGIQFFVPVYLNGKELAWKTRIVPTRFKTIIKMTKITEEIETKPGETKRTYIYDLAIRTGTWHMPSRNPDKSLVVVDVDGWDRLPLEIKRILEDNPTLTFKTQRGAHFYFWVPRHYRKTQIGAGVDWLGWGSYAVITGEDRYLIYVAEIPELSHEVAKKLYNEVKATKLSPPSRWKPSPSRAHVEEEFSAMEGERNHKINATLYRYRRESDEYLENLAIQLADKCDPPYPYSEARAIVRSIANNRHRFPSTKTPPPEVKKTDEKEDQEIGWSDNTAYQRLGMFFRDTEKKEFTIFEYEEYLEFRGWERNKNGRIAAAQKDVAEMLKKGSLKKIGKAPSQGGRPPDLYAPTQRWMLPPKDLPYKPTVQNIRVSRMATLMADYPQEMVRKTLAGEMGGVSERSISRYAKRLAEDPIWERPIIIRQIAKVQVDWSKVNKEVEKGAEKWAGALSFKPTTYQLTDAYYSALTRLNWRIRGRFSSLGVPGSNFSSVWDDKGHAVATPCLSETEKQISPEESVVEEPFSRVVRHYSCPICEDSMEKEGFCDTCTVKIEEIRKRRLEVGGYGTLEQSVTDFCEKTYAFFSTHILPLRGVDPKVEDYYFEVNPPVKIYYCPNPVCSGQVHTGFYTDYTMPVKCPHCGAWVGAHWRNEPNPPEESLYGYPLNRYNREWRPYFEMMDDLWEAREYGNRGELKLLGRNFEKLFEPEILAGWKEYRKQLFTEIEIPCLTCGQLRTAVVKIGSTVKAIRLCQICVDRIVYDANLPKEALKRLTENELTDKNMRYGYFFALYDRLFKTTTRKPRDLMYLIRRYNDEWIELAMYVAKRNVKSVKYIYPYIRGILRNWQTQGFINQNDYDNHKHYQYGIFVSKDVEAEASAVLMYKDPYIAYDNHIHNLTYEIAILIYRAELQVGTPNVIYAISEAVRYSVRKWSYCEAIIERLDWHPPVQNSLIRNQDIDMTKQEEEIMWEVRDGNERFLSKRQRYILDLMKDADKRQSEEDFRIWRETLDDDTDILY